MKQKYPHIKGMKDIASATLNTTIIHNKDGENQSFSYNEKQIWVNK